MTIAQAAELGFSGAGASPSNPDGAVGFSDVDTFDYNSAPNQPPVIGETDFFGTGEHEISEVIGRDSDIGSDKTGTEVATTFYSPMDLFRYTAPNMRALSPFTDPAYFSINSGTTPLGYWNDYTTGDSGDLGDWEENADPPAPATRPTPITTAAKATSTTPSHQTTSR